MIVLGVETSCDETAAAVVEDGLRIRSSTVASQVRVHSPYGGVVPELASREHVDNICFIVERACQEAELSPADVDALAATRGPGLVGALLVGLTYAKSMAYALGKPFVGVNHLEGHLFSIFLDHPGAELPALSLVVSGGHTNLYFLEEAGRSRLLAKTRDDAAGEALDKLSKLLGMGYPGGPVIDRLARHGDSAAVEFSMPRFRDGSLDFSFSGIKSSALRYAQQHQLGALDPDKVDRPVEIPIEILNLVASFQQAVIDQLFERLERALEEATVRSVHFSGGVSCNSALRTQAAARFQKHGLPVYFPRPELTTDNAAMIAAAAFHRLKKGERDPWSLSAEPNLKVS